MSCTGTGSIMSMSPDSSAATRVASDLMVWKTTSVRLCSGLPHQFGLGLKTVFTPGSWLAIMKGPVPLALSANGFSDVAVAGCACVAPFASAQHEVEMIYEMRERLEPLAIIESLGRIDEADLERIEEVQRRIEQNDDVEKFLDLDREFHMLTYSGCHLDTLMSMVTRLWNATQHYRRAYVALGGRDRMWVVNVEHRLILDAMMRHDAVDAERYLGGHIRRTRIELRHHPGVFE